MHANGVHATPITSANFDTFLAENEMAFVSFYAPWCIWCQRLHPTWEQFAEKVEEESMPIAVASVDCVENSNLCAAQKIAAFPTLRWFARQEAVLPDYKQDRTVNALNSFAARKLENEEKFKKWEENAANKKDKSKKTPPPPPVAGKPDHPGCQVSGYLEVNRVPGNFHIEAHSVNHNLNSAMTNLSHVVNHVSFGEPPTRQTQRVKKYLAGIPQDHKNFSPLDGKEYVSDQFHRAHHHYLSIVSTHFDDQFVKYQFLAQSQEVMYEVADVPEARFSYDLSPMAVTVSKVSQKSWYEFVTSCFAIVGGTFTTLGLIDGILYKAFKPKKL
jgi:protein disulfide-isomerase-like protein